MSVLNHQFVRIRRTWVDVTSSASRRDGILLYQPGRKILRIIPWLLGEFSFLPWHKVIGREGVSSFRTILPDFDLERAVGPVNYVTIYTGNGTVKSKFTLLVKLRDSPNQNIIVKVGNTSGAAEAIRHEYEVLEKLKGSALGGQVPQPIALGLQDRWTWASQTVLPRGKSSNCLQVEHFEFLSQLRQIGIRHGDFAPWNCSIVKGMLMVWDWEDAGEWNDGEDERHFRQQVETLLGKDH